MSEGIGDKMSVWHIGYEHKKHVANFGITSTWHHACLSSVGSGNWAQALMVAQQACNNWAHPAPQAFLLNNPAPYSSVLIFLFKSEVLFFPLLFCFIEE